MPMIDIQTVILIITFLASQYSPGTMELVIANRQAGNAWVTIPQNLPQVDGYIAVVNCSDLMQVWDLRPRGARNWERFLVVDCADPTKDGGQWMCDHHIGVEIDHATALRWNTVDEMIHVERRIDTTQLQMGPCRKDLKW